MSAAQASSERQVAVGQVLGAYGVRGWLKVKSYTEPLDNILHYAPWRLEHKGQCSEHAVLAGKVQGGTVVVQLDGVHVREDAMALAGATVTVDRGCLPTLGRGEYYWTDLIGLAVTNLQGVSLGTVDRLFETGANDVLVVRDGETERLVPYVLGQYVLDIDLAAGRMVVDWDPDF